MPTRAEDLHIIQDITFPSLLGGRRLNAPAASQVHFGYAEVAVFQALLSNLKPRCAIEIGTQTGATLEIIAKHSERVISIDIDPQVKVNLDAKFPNVEFVVGSSHDVLPVLLKRLASEGTTPGFIFVDGDHTAQGVKTDLEHILSFQPTAQMTVLMHDTFNPWCRDGILAANWARNPYCHFVDVDFCPGVLHPDESCLRQMWGGLGYAVFLPEQRSHQLEVKTSHRLLFEAAFVKSVYCDQFRKK